jgi:hypothetical protein
MTMACALNQLFVILTNINQEIHALIALIPVSHALQVLTAYHAKLVKLL